MINVRAFAADVESFCRLATLPPIEIQRPTSCPRCGQPSHPPGGRLGIYSHGTYERQVRGFVPGKWLTVIVRRFLCLGCDVTISVLPDFLVARRWYLGATILRVLIEVLLKDTSVAKMRESVGPDNRTPHWRAPADWARELGLKIWKGAVPGILKSDEPDCIERLQKLLGSKGIHERSPDAEIEAAARQLSLATGAVLEPL